MRLPAETYGRLRGDAPEGFVMRDGRLYRVEGFGFVANASGARVVPKLMGAYRARAWFSLVSLLIVAGAVGLLAWALPRRHLDPLGELAFLAASLAAVLLAGPLTWAMNAVWLATGGILLALAWPSAGARPSLALLGLGFGLFLAWLPDQYALVPVFGSPPTGLGDYKYVVGELTVLVCAAIFVRLGGRKDTGPGNGPD